MTANLENTQQQLTWVQHQRTALQAVLKHRMSPPSLEQRQIPGFNPNDPKDIWQCTQQLRSRLSEWKSVVFRIAHAIAFFNTLARA